MFTDEQIDEIGSMLEDKGLTHSEIDTYFEHRGVKGMKWGIRKGKSVEGVNRFVGQRRDGNDLVVYKTKQKQKYVSLPADSPKKKDIEAVWRASAKTGQIFLTDKFQKKTWDKRVSRLSAENARLTKGKLTARDYLMVYGAIGVSAISLGYGLATGDSDRIRRSSIYLVGDTADTFVKVRPKAIENKGYGYKRTKSS